MCIDTYKNLHTKTNCRKHVSLQSAVTTLSVSHPSLQHSCSGSESAVSHTHPTPADKSPRSVSSTTHNILTADSHTCAAVPVEQPPHTAKPPVNDSMVSVTHTKPKQQQTALQLAQKAKRRYTTDGKVLCLVDVRARPPYVLFPCSLAPGRKGN